MGLSGKKIINLIWVFARIVFGAALYAAGFKFFLYQNDIIVGGLTGVAMIINYLTALPVGVMLIVMNIPLFIVAWRKFGLAYMIGSLVGMIVSSVLVDLFDLVPFRATSEPLLASIYGGVLEGLGLGLICSAGGSSGGADIAAKMLRARYPFVNFGTIMLILDIVVITAFAAIFRKYDSAMYALIAMFVVSRLIDLVLYGADSSKVCHIITDRSEDMRVAITERLGRGATLLYGRGAFSGKEKQIILCVIKRSQIAEIRKTVRDIDESAFIIMSESHEVYGKGFGSLDNIK